MSRPPAFDRNQVIDEAMALFWRQGFHATSIQQLVEATGVNRASMYQTFGDKRGLFRAAMDRYINERSAKRIAAVDRTGSPLAVIRGYFLALIAAESDIERQMGCFLTNSAVELAPIEGEVKQRVQAVFTAMRDRLAAAIHSGQADGSIRRDIEPDALADMLLGLLQGLRVLARSGSDKAEIEANIETALKVIG